jgi:hypothetical protein
VENIAEGEKYLFTVSRPFIAFETSKKDWIAFQCKESFQNVRAKNVYMAVVSEV